MKRSGVSFLLILITITSALLLCCLSQSESAEEPPDGSKADKYKSPSVEPKTNPNNQRESIPPTAFEKSLVESLGAIANKQKAAYEQRHAEQKPWWIDYGLLLIGAAYTVFAALQWWAVRDQGNIAARSLAHIERTERPWIVFQVDDWGLPDRNNAKSGFAGEIKWSLINAGRSPAFVTELVAAHEVLPYPLPDKPPVDQSTGQIGKFILPPNGKQSSLPTAVGAGAMQGIFDGKSCQVVYGIVRYDDSGGNHHLTRFCALKRKDAEGWKLEPAGPPDWVDHT